MIWIALRHMDPWVPLITSLFGVCGVFALTSEGAQWLPVTYTFFAWGAGLFVYGWFLQYLLVLRFRWIGLHYGGKDK